MTKAGFVFSALLAGTLAIAQPAARTAAQEHQAQPPAEEGSAGEAGAETIRSGERLTLRRCVDTALKNQPGIAVARSAVQAGQGRVGQALAAYYPQVALAGGYVAGSSGADGSGDEITAGVTLSQNIYDFGRTSSQVGVQRFGLEAARSDLEDVTVQTVFRVKEAYYAVLQAKRNRDLAEEVVGQFQQHLEQAKNFVKVGISPRFDVIKAEVDLSNARLNLIKAGNSLRLAFAGLNNAMGVPEAPEYDIEDNLSFGKYEASFDKALSRAVANRQDMRSAEAKIRAAEQAVAFARAGYLPTLTGSAAYARAGERTFSREDWTAGVTLSLPLFNGFLTRHQVTEAEAGLKSQTAQTELLRQTIYLEVRQAFLNLKEAEERIPAAELAVSQATEGLAMTNGRYATGVGSPIEVTDAQAAYSNAKSAYIQALSDYKTAIASLERAQGER